MSYDGREKDIIVPYGVEKIAYDFFTNPVTSITIPDSVKEINYQNSFYETGTVIKCKENSFAHSSAKENNQKFELIK